MSRYQRQYDAHYIITRAMQADRARVARIRISACDGKTLRLTLTDGSIIEANVVFSAASGPNVKERERR